MKSKKTHGNNKKNQPKCIIPSLVLNQKNNLNFLSNIKSRVVTCRKLNVSVSLLTFSKGSKSSVTTEYVYVICVELYQIQHLLRGLVFDMPFKINKENILAEIFL